MKKALFLDRDGVINEDYGHVYKIEDFKFIKNIFKVCTYFKNLGYIIVIISNQAGVAKGLYTLEDLSKLDSYMKSEFSKHMITIEGSYYCTHHPKDNCTCRKPMPGLIFKAQKELNIDLNNSILIGDKMSDLIAGNKAGIRKLYFKKGMYPETPVDFEYKVITF